MKALAAPALERHVVAKARKRLIWVPTLALALSASTAHAALTDTPISWSLFTANPYYSGTSPMRDAQNFGGDKDDTNGGANFSAEAEISSGGNGTNSTAANCNPFIAATHRCGTETSAFWGYYNGGTTWDGVYASASMLDDYLFFRMRVDATPDENNGSLKSNHWNFLLDVDGDGYKEFWIDVDGKPAGFNDTVHIYYEDLTSQNITTTAAPILREDFQGCRGGTGLPAVCAFAHSRSLPVTDVTPGDTSGEWYVDVQVPLRSLQRPLVAGICPFTGTAASPCYAMTPNTPYTAIFSTSDSSTDPLQKDFVGRCSEPFNPALPCTFGVPVPVTLGYLESRIDANGKLSVQFTTVAEVANVGFELSSDREGKQALSATPVASLHGSTAEIADYRFDGARAPANGRFYLVDVDTRGRRTAHGPFDVGRTYGRKPTIERPDWRAISRAAIAPRGTTAQGALLWVAQAGIQRVAVADLASAGVDLAGLPAANIALSRDGVAVPRRILDAPGGVLGTNSSIEFIGTPARSLYSDAAAYRVRVVNGGGLEFAHDTARHGATVGAWSEHEARYAPQRQYNFATPTNDPWFADRIVAYAGAGAGVTTALPMSALADVAGVNARVQAELIGATDWESGGMDHHARLLINDQGVADGYADGVEAFALNAALSTAGLGSGVDARVHVPADLGFAYEVVNVEAIALTYPRLARAEAGAWSGNAVRWTPAAGNANTEPAPSGSGDALFDAGFEVAESQAQSVAIDGYASADVVAYTERSGQWYWIADVRTAPRHDAYTAWVPVAAEGQNLWVAEATATARPRVSAAPAAISVPTNTDYLVITAGAFADELAPLLARRQAQGLRTAAVDVEQAFLHYSHGMPEPAAIDALIRETAANARLRYVLLVGADVYDYNDYLGLGARSFVPTHYRFTNEVMRYTPTDVPYVDLDGDQVADLAIGRLPVRTAPELQALIAKMLAYEGAGERGAVFAAGGSDAQADFTRLSDEMLGLYPSFASTARAYVDQGGAAAARTQLLNGLNAGPSLVNFMGHSAPSIWTYDPLLTYSDIATLNNIGHPSVVVQWGCWNTYFVSPYANAMVHAWLLTPERGAAAVIGSVGLSELDAHRELGAQLAQRWLPGARIGDALLAAKRALAQTAPGRLDAQLGVLLLGDPAMLVR